MEYEPIDIEARKREICDQDTFEKAHDFAARLINDLAEERSKLLSGECAHCEDKQRAINALNAYVARLTDSTGKNLAYVERCFMEHRIEELASDDFSGVYFQAEDVAREIAKTADGLSAQLDACAAGPWRTDVENAPKDGSEFLIWYDDQDAGWQLRIIHWYEPFKNFRDRMDYGVYMPCMAAFAVPNPPQVTT